MCGIAGIWSERGGEQDEQAARVERMLDRLAHRGPDGHGLLRDAAAGLVLGHRRLSIIDIAGGAQPMSTADGALSITFNGEIYNYVELRAELVARGCRMVTDSDTEVILHLYREHGPGCLHKLRGMFALAIWDHQRRELLLARDRMGKKPLYYSDAGGELVFASEIKAVVAGLGGRVDVDEQALVDYLGWGMVPAPATIYRQVRALPAGTYLHLRPGARARGAQPATRYWRLDFRPTREIAFADAVELLDTALREAVRLRLRSDVPVGAFLSGGIDSGLIAAIAAQLYDRPLCTVTIGYEDPSTDERPLARMVAERYSTIHHEEVIASPDAPRALVDMAHSFDQPYANSSAIPNAIVAAIARRHVKVVLTGDGGDEILAGYRRYGAARVSGWLAPLDTAAGQAMWRALAGSLPVPLRTRSRYELVHRVVRGLGSDPVRRYMAWTVDLFDHDSLSALGARWHRALMPAHRLAADLYGEYRGAGAVNRMMAMDAHILLTDNLNLKLDMCTMQHGLEARSPLLDHVLVDMAARLPEAVKVRGRQTKPLLRALAERYLPEPVCTATKRGFEVPLADWLDGDLAAMRTEMLCSPTGLLAERFDRAALAALATCPAERRPRSWPMQVLALLMLGIWDQSVRSDTRE